MKKEMYKSMYETENYHWYFKSKREIVLACLKKYLRHKGKIVDLGCGCGLMLTELEKYGTVTGVDASEEAIEYCKTLFSGELIQGDLSELGMENTFDCAILLDVLEHVEDEKLILENIRNSLHNRGLLILTVPADMRLWSQHDENCMHYRRYERKELIDILRKCNYKVKFIGYYNSRLYPFVYAVRKVERMLKIKNKGSHIEYGFKPGPVNTVLYKIFSGEKKRILKEKPYAHGVSLICVAERGNEK